MAKRTQMIVSLIAILHCMDLSISHTWDREENQKWEGGDLVRLGRRNVETVKRVGTCDRCGSQKVQVYWVNETKHLMDKIGHNQYRYSTEYLERERLSQSEVRYKIWKETAAS